MAVQVQPKVPVRVGVRMRRSTDQTIATGTLVKIQFDTTEEDTHGFWSSGANTRLTVPAGQGGIYIFRGHARYDTNGPTAEPLVGYLINGTIVDRSQPVGSMAFMSVQISGPVRLAVGDYVEFAVAHSAGSNRTISAVTTDSGFDPKSPVAEIWRFSP